MGAPPNVVAHKPHFHRNRPWKEPVRAATTAAGTLASSFADGSIIDGVTLSTQAPDFEAKAKQIATAKREVAAALKEAGGKPLAEQRAAQ